MTRFYHACADAASELGEQAPGREIVEPTSGNTGISLAAMARARGYHMRAVVLQRIQEEKKLLFRIVGAEVTWSRTLSARFPDNVFKYVSTMKEHLPELAGGTEARLTHRAR